MKILFRADSSTQIGTGHISRCLALAEALRDRGAEVSFLCREGPNDSLSLLRQRGFQAFPLPGALSEAADAAACEPILQKEKPAWLVVDHYGLGLEWEKQARPHVGQILVIDDSAQRSHDCDLFLNQNHLAEAPPKDEKRISLLGPKYALLHPSFAKARQVEKPRRDFPARRILVSFGGGDANNETSRLLGALQAVAAEIELDVVLGAANPHQEKVRALLNHFPRAKLHVNTDQMARLMAEADLAFGAGGISTWERACLGLPSVVTALAPNQEAGAAHLATEGNHLYLGPVAQVAPEMYLHAYQMLRQSPWLAAQLSTQGGALVDGKGAERVARRLVPPKLSLRLARPEDEAPMLNWRNAPETREFFFDPGEVSPDQHHAWFRASLENPQRALLVAEANGSPKGVLRFDLAEKTAVVSIYLVPGTHGQGLGSEILLAGNRWLRSHHPQIESVHAEVMAENKKSIQAFRNAGYAWRNLALEMRLT